MSHTVDTKDASAVEREVAESYRELYADSDPQFMPRAFGWLVDCFAGRYRDFQAIDLQYHDLEHTLQGTLCLGRLLTGYQQAGAVPALDRRRFELGILAILFHDSGYRHRGEVHVHPRRPQRGVRRPVAGGKGLLRAGHPGRAEHDSLHRAERGTRRDSL
jgi:hypothetical protein